MIYILLYTYIFGIKKGMLCVFVFLRVWLVYSVLSLSAIQYSGPFIHKTFEGEEK